MVNINNFFRLGISPGLLYKKAMSNQLEHLIAVYECCTFQEYDTLEMFLPDDKNIRELEIEYIKQSGKSINYNTPVDLQLDGLYNCGSDNPQYRANALNYVKKHIDYAAEGGAKIFVVTGCVDQGEDKREEIMNRYESYFYQLSSYAKQFGITVVLEPIERGHFKNLNLGPTSECAAFIKRMKQSGCENAKLMVDSAHLPLMGEVFDEAVDLSLKVGLAHIHLGNAVVHNKDNVFYGHTHPPIGIQDGEFDVEDVVGIFNKLFQVGYLNLEPEKYKPTISLEIASYPGVSPVTSARLAFEKVHTAFQLAVSSLTNNS